MFLTAVGLTIRWGKTCGIRKISQLINLTFYYLSDGLEYLYRVNYSLFNLFIKDYAKQIQS